MEDFAMGEGVLEGVLLEERERNIRMQESQNVRLLELPKGKIVKKSYDSREYYYLMFREKEKVRTKYLGKDIDLIEQVQKQLDERKYVKDVLKRLKDELKMINRVIR
jgi:hypothetical protein